MKKPLKEMLKKIGGNHLLSEGPAYEYATEVKKIEKFKALHDKELGILIKKIAKHVQFFHPFRRFSRRS